MFLATSFNTFLISPPNEGGAAVARVIWLRGLLGASPDCLFTAATDAAGRSSPHALPSASFAKALPWTVLFEPSPTSSGCRWGSSFSSAAAGRPSSHAIVESSPFKSSC
ncbi:hypothetical protein NMY22_g5551 [Coprinellus aureogranulatus]|nr:hypothetical protein NMY22_g5551 [Coprinellus aureogranulatus]